MKTLEIEDLQTDLRAFIDAAQEESVLVTRHGKPAALVVGVESHDLEDLQLETDPAFWKMIEERRRQPTMSRAELDEYLREHDSRRKNRGKRA